MSKLLLTAFLAGFFLTWVRADGAELFVDSSTVSSGSSTIVAVSFQSMSDQVSSLQFDVTFDNSVLGLAAAAGSSVHASAKSLYVATPDSGSFRILLTSMSRNLLNDGPLVTLFLNALPNAPPGYTTVAISNISASDPDGNAVAIPDTSASMSIVSGPSTPLLAQGVLNGASLLSGAVAPGEIITFIGAGIGPGVAVPLQLTPSGSVATEASGYQVLFDSVPAPLIYASASQINAIVPFELAGNPTSAMSVIKDGQPIAALTLDVQPYAVGLFTQSATGVGQVLGANEDGTLNGVLNPALPGSVITIYVTGGGLTDPPGVTGGVTAGGGSLVGSTVATIDGHPVEITYAGPAPGSVAGLIQINLRVPAEASPSPGAPLYVAIENLASQDGVTVAIGSVQ